MAGVEGFSLGFGGVSGIVIGFKFCRVEGGLAGDAQQKGTRPLRIPKSSLAKWPCSKVRLDFSTSTCFQSFQAPSPTFMIGDGASRFGPATDVNVGEVLPQQSHLFLDMIRRQKKHTGQSWYEKFFEVLFIQSFS